VNLAGSSTSDRYSCTPLGGTFGTLSCSARGTNTALFINNFKGGSWAATSWTGWGGIAGTVNGGSSCAQAATGQISCAAVASDAALWTNSFNGTSWSGWTKRGGVQIGNPGCTALSAGKVLCAVIGVNGKATSTIGP
jgi:hypothetical protein